MCPFATRGAPVRSLADYRGAIVTFSDWRATCQVLYQYADGISITFSPLLQQQNTEPAIGSAMHLTRKSLQFAQSVARTTLARGFSSAAALPPSPSHSAPDSSGGANSSGGSPRDTPSTRSAAAASVRSVPGGPGLEHFLRAQGQAERPAGAGSAAALQVRSAL